MKLMIRRTDKGLSAYVPKKDLEETIISCERETLWGGEITLRNGWVFTLPELPPDTRLPITVEAKRTGSGSD